MRAYITLAAVAAATATLAPVGAAGAQESDESSSRGWRPRVIAGGGLNFAQPVGEFAEHVNGAGGGSAFVVLGLDRAGVFGLRMDGGFLIYGHERKRVPLSNTIGGRIQVDLTTDNNIALFGIGPQITAPSGPVRPYLNGTAGLAYFFTQSSVDGSSGDNTPFARTENYRDPVFAWTGGGGVYIPLSARRTPVMLEIGAKFHGNGRARYLKEGSIQDNPDATISFTPIESRTDFVSYHLGVSFQIR
jgi:hypothetical protein